MVARVSGIGSVSGTLGARATGSFGEVCMSALGADTQGEKDASCSKEKSFLFWFLGSDDIAVLCLWRMWCASRQLGNVPREGSTGGMKPSADVCGVAARGLSEDQPQANRPTPDSAPKGEQGEQGEGALSPSPLNGGKVGCTLEAGLAERGCCADPTWSQAMVRAGNHTPRTAGEEHMRGEGVRE